MRYERRVLFALCEKVVERAGRFEEDELAGYTRNELLVRLAKDFIRTNKGKLK